MDRKKLKIILAISIAASAIILLHIRFLGLPVGPRVLFFYLNQYLYVMIPGLIIVALSLFIPQINRAGQIIAVFLLGVVGYSVADMIYSHFRIALPGVQNASLNLIYGDLNGYFFNRCYQYLPILLMILVLFPSRNDRESSLLKFGNWNMETGTIDKNNPMPWKRVVLRISSFALIMAFIALALRVMTSEKFGAGLHNGISSWLDFLLNTRFGALRPIHEQLTLIPSNVLGAVNNCFIEELIFRGILLTVFCRVIGDKWGNVLQAFLFGLVHFPSFNFWHYLAKIIVFSFLGWLFGRAAIETGGIKSSWSIHSAIVISMYVAQTI